METATVDVSPAPSGRGLKGVLAKARRAGKDTSSTTSVNGTDNSSDSHRLRSSIDSTRDRARTSRESSIDDGTTTASNTRKLSKLIPGRIKQKLKKKGGAEREGELEEQEEEEDQDDGRGRRTSDQAATSADLTRSAGSRSQSTLGGISLITIDDPDSES